MTLSLEDKEQPRRLKLVLNRPPYERVPLSTKGATVFAILALLSEGKMTRSVIFTAYSLSFLEL